MVDGFTAVSFCKIQIIFITLKEKGKQNTWEWKKEIAME